jgi:hypothetical protein
VYRRIYLDGRKPSAKVLDDPTFAGYSTGHWEGETLVVDTVAIREDTLFDTFSPHSDQFTVRERIRFVSPGVIEDQITSIGSESAGRTLHRRSDVSQGGAAERRTARVLVRRGIGHDEVGVRTRPDVQRHGTGDAAEAVVVKPP